MKKTMISVVMIAIIAVDLGCASYRPDSLSRLDGDFAPYTQELEQVTLSAKKLTAAESKKYLDRDVIVKGFQPVQLSIDNRSDDYVLFSPKRVSLPCADPDDVAKSVHTNTTGRVLAWGIPGLLLWPLIIPAIVDGIGSSNANQDLDADFAAKSLGETVVQPKSFYEGLIFVPTESFTPSFEVRLLERESHTELKFMVTAN